MVFLLGFLAVPRGEEEMEEEVVQLVLNTLSNLVNDPTTKESFLLYPFSLSVRHFVYVLKRTLSPTNRVLALEV